MSTIFSDIQRPYNTVTTPDQQDADATGNDQGPTDQMPMAKILAAVMRGAAKVQGQEQAKKVSASQQASNARMTVTMKPGAAGEPPLVTVKDAPADLLNGTQQSDLRKTYDAPTNQVESKLAATGIAEHTKPQATDAASPSGVEASAIPTTQPDTSHPLEQAAVAVDAAKGYRLPRPWDPDIREKLKSEEGLRAIAEEMGDPDPKADAHRAWRQIQKGIATPDGVAQRVADFRAQRIEKESHALQATLAPYEQDKEAAQRENDRKASEARQLQALKDTEQRAVYTRWNAIKDKTDWANIPKDQRRQTFDDQNDTGVSPTDAVYNQIDRVADRQVREFFDEFFVKKSETYQLGHYPTFESAKMAYGHDFADKNEESRARNAWSSAHAYTQRQIADDAAKQENRQLRSEMLLQRIQAASTDKPVPIGRADLALMPTSEVLAMDFSKVKNPDSVLEQKEGLIRKDLQDHTEKRAIYNAQAKGILSKGDPASWDRGDREQLAGWQAQTKIANDHIAAAQAELAQIQAARAARKNGAATPAARKVGDRKTFTSGPYKGKTGTWNGTGYVVQ